LLCGLLWWFLFSFFLTYAVEDRLLGQAMPYVVTALVIWVCQRPVTAVVVTAVAGLFFTCNTLVATGRIPPGSTPKAVRFLFPVPEFQQPIPEVGLLPFARQLDAAIAVEER